MRGLSAVLAALLIATPALGAEDAAPATLDSVSACVRANAPAKTMRQRVELKIVDRMGDGRSYDLKGEWKRDEDGLSKAMLRVSAPPDLRGSAFLMLEQADRQPDLFSYLPELEKVRRITVRAAAGQLFGSDFTYEDIRRIQNLAEAANSVLLGEEEVAGRAAWKIETTPGPEDGSVYTRIVSFVDRERCVPLGAELFETGPEPSKRLEVPPGRVVREGGGWVPMQLSMEDLENGTRSVMTVKDVELDVDLPDRNFTQSALRRRR